MIEKGTFFFWICITINETIKKKCGHKDALLFVDCIKHINLYLIILPKKHVPQLKFNKYDRE